MNLPGGPNKMLVRKVRSVWIADCAGCPVTVGFVTRPTHGLALTWALSHVKAHKGLQHIEKGPVYR